MKKRGLLSDKKADTVVLETTIFIILNLVFIAILLIFVWSSGKGAFNYEESYAKQIALLIDNSKPEMTLSLGINKGVEIAEEKGIKKEDINKIVRIDEKENRIIVDLTGKGGYSYQYFSDYFVETEIISGARDEKYLTIKIKEK
ncbi:MAG TPA: hypothetical protein VMZ91_11005 [Candidatus Paceibacterota bacterium]|nr:hypothetical protein [Candidatus Paceibacterota bacterium]